jgi:hypothetical protein
MGAVQAQDYPGSLWAVGQRLKGATERTIEDGIAGRSIVRTWPMRGTLHYVSARDVRWMLRLLTPRVLASLKWRNRQLELDAPALARARRILEKALRGGRRLTRPAAYAALQAGGVSPAGQRGIHVLGHLALEGVLCFGPKEARQPTFVLLEEWVPPAPEVPRDVAMARLAERYLASHAPASVQDFAWWSGLTVKDAQQATAEARPAAAVRPKAPATPCAHLLTPWDEYLVAYRDRSAAYGPAVARKNPLAVLGNSLIVIDGRVRGAWRRSLAPATVQVRLQFWDRPTAAEREAVRRAVRRYGRFLGREIED